MSSAYDDYIRQAGNLASAETSQQQNLFDQYTSKYSAEAARENTKKGVDVGKALFDISQGENILMSSVSLGASGIAAVRVGKGAYAHMQGVYNKHFPGDDDAEALEDAQSGEAGSLTSAEAESAGITGRAGAADLEGVQMADQAGEVSMAIDYGVAEEAGEAAIHGMAGEEAAWGHAPSEGGEMQEMAGEGIGEGGTAAAEAETAEAGTALEGLAQGAADASAAAADAAGAAVGGAGVDIGVATAAASDAALAAAGEAAGAGLAGFLGESAVAFAAVAPEIALAAAAGYGIYEGIQGIEEGETEKKASDADPVNPREDFGARNPNLAKSIAVPVFDSTRGYNTGHSTSY